MDDDFTKLKEDHDVALSGALDSLIERDKSKITAENIESIKKVIPDAIARKISQIVPEGFELAQIEFTGEVSGKPFGIGVSGQVSVTFEKKR
jgi:hypothetical protein